MMDAEAKELGTEIYGQEVFTATSFQVPWPLRLFTTKSNGTSKLIAWGWSWEAALEALRQIVACKT